MILVGDIGGTNARIALASIDGTHVEIERTTTYESGAYPGLVEVLTEFLDGDDCEIHKAAFGIAGPIVDGRCEATNIPWRIDAREITQRLSIDKVGLLNDLESTAWGIETLREEDTIVINPGIENARGNRAVVSAGTGLGEAGVYWDGKDYHPFATEGGHTDFAPRNELEFELLGFLISMYGRISYERIVSGPGLYNIYRFFKATDRYTGKSEIEDRLKEAHKADRGPIITEAALNGSCERCDAVLDLFMTLYGSETGNVALKMLSTGGVWLGGGIIKAVGPVLEQREDGFDRFREALTSKGRLSPLIEQTPVRAILDGAIALRGAAMYAQRRFG